MSFFELLGEGLLVEFLKSYVDPIALANLSSTSRSFYDVICGEGGVCDAYINSLVSRTAFERLSLRYSKVQVVFLLLEIEAARKCSFKLSCGKAHTAVVSREGELYTFGEGAAGQLGHGSRAQSTAPRIVEFPLRIRIASVSCGTDHTMVLANRGALYGFGSNRRGALGNNLKPNVLRPEPILLPLESDIVALATGKDFSALLLATGEVNVLGDGLPADYEPGGNLTLPQEMVPEERFVKVSAGDDHMLLLSNIGKPYAVGCNTHGKLGLEMHSSADGVEQFEEVSRQIKPVDFAWRNKSIAQISTGSHHSALVTKDGELFTWGNNINGQLGHSRFGKACAIPLKVQLPGQNDFVVSVACGTAHTIVNTIAGTIVAFGNASFSQVGYTQFWATSRPQVYACTLLLG